MNFWQGKLIRLRGTEPSDADFLFAWNRDSEMARNLDFVWPPVSHAQVTQMVTEQTKKLLENDTFSWIIEDTAGAAVGSITTHNCNPRTGTFSYGVAVTREQQRKGYAREAIQLVLHYYFAELRYHKVAVRIFSHNLASISLHGKLGFVHEGTLRQEVYTRGTYFDILCYGLLQAEWVKLFPHLDCLSLAGGLSSQV